MERSVHACHVCATELRDCEEEPEWLQAKQANSEVCVCVCV